MFGNSMQIYVELCKRKASMGTLINLIQQIKYTFNYENNF